MKISMSLSSKSIFKAAEQLRQYNKDLESKNEEFVRRLSELGKEVALSAVSESPLGKVVTVTTNIEQAEAGCKAVVVATGRTVTSSDGREFNLLLAIEFGAGIRYNKSENPNAADFGMGVGTFPDQKHAFDEEGWYYLGDDDKWHHSYGVKATMPMYRASSEIIQNIRNIAVEVFGENTESE